MQWSRYRSSSSSISIFQWASILQRGFKAPALSSTTSGTATQEPAIQIYERLQEQGVAPATSILLAALKACTSSGDFSTGEKIHSSFITSGATPPVIISNSLIHMYSKAGRIQDAEIAFNSMKHRSVVSWNSIILGLAENNRGARALELYRRMQDEGFDPNCATLVAALKACTSIAVDSRSDRELVLETGKLIHTQAREKGLEQDLRLASTLVDMYAKCGCLLEAREIFDAMPERSVITWNAIINGYAENGDSANALELFSKLQECGGSVSPNAQTLMAVLKACSCSAEGCSSKQLRLEKCRELHFLASESGHAKDVKVANAVMNLYGKCGSLEEARRVFDGIQTRSVSSWNTMIFAYAENERGKSGLQLFDQMTLGSRGPEPDAITFVAAIKSCASFASQSETKNKPGLLEKGSLLHTRASEAGHSSNIRVACSLIDMYTKCGSLENAFRVFDRMNTRDVASWNALIMGCSLSGDPQAALKLFSRMQKERVSPDTRTFVAVLKACVVLSSGDQHSRCPEQVRIIHAQLAEAGFESDNFVAGALLDAYSKSGSMDDASTFFHRRLSSHADVVSWNTMINGFTDNGQPELALRYFTRMQEAGVQPDELTLVSALRACSSLGALETGKRIYAGVCEAGSLPADALMLQTSLLDFYAKCGSMPEAEKVFNSMKTKDVVSWNALIAGYAHQGNADRVFELFEAMKNRAGIEATSITFLSVLNVCSHAGLVEKGREFFEMMKRSRITPIIEHYCCFVDLLSRANHLEEAVGVVRGMPLEPNPTIWRTLLAAARKWKNVDLGMLAFDELVKLQEKDSSAYVLMANTYSARF